MERQIDWQDNKTIHSNALRLLELSFDWMTNNDWMKYDDDQEAWECIDSIVEAMERTCPRDKEE